jgi:hypothetical protein
MSLTNALTQLRNVIESVAVGYKKADDKVLNLADEEPPGVDKKYLVKVVSRDTPGLTFSNLRNTRANVMVQLSREVSGGSAAGYDFQSVQDSLEDVGFSIIKNFEMPSNWDYTNTEIVLVNTQEGESISATEGNKSLVWTVNFELFIRRQV